jgi:hypothetical protein
LTNYKVTYYTNGDTIETKTITAPNSEKAIDFLANNPLIPFAQLKEITAMSTPTNQPQPLTPAQQAAREDAAQFRADLRADLAEIMDELHSQRAELINVRADLEAIRAGLQAASKPAPSGTFAEMTIDNIIMTYDDKGKPAYKATGTPYNKFGVRVWDEVLPTLGIDPLTLKPGPNPQKEIRARVLMNEPEEGKTAQPRKITGKA